MVRGRPLIVLNPALDLVFATAIEELLADGVPPLDDFHARLVERYPLVTVRSDQFDGEPSTVWFIYRDGQWTDERSGPKGPTGGDPPRRAATG